MIATVKFDKPELEEMLAAELRRRFGFDIKAEDVTLDYDVNGDDTDEVFANVLVLNLPERGVE